MGMSTHVVGFRSDNDPEYKKHSKVLRACIDAGIKQLPKETADYFGYASPEEYLFEDALEIEIPTKKWGDFYRQGFEIKVSEIPSGVDIIRFYNSH
jgi:hypothetical protein